jgi:hypothetical protein
LVNLTSFNRIQKNWFKSLHSFFSLNMDQFYPPIF